MKAGKQRHYCPVRLTSQLIGRLNRVIKDFCLRPLFATSKGISPCSISGYDVSLNPEKNATQTLQTIDEVWILVFEVLKLKVSKPSSKINDESMCKTVGKGSLDKMMMNINDDDDDDKDKMIMSIMMMMMVRSIVGVLTWNNEEDGEADLWFGVHLTLVLPDISQLDNRNYYHNY